MRQRGFSLTEVLIATAISSLLLIGASRFLPGLQRAVLLQSARESWKKRSGSACLLSANSFSVRVTVRGTARGRGWRSQSKAVASLFGGMPTVTVAGIAVHQKTTAPVFVWNRARWKPFVGQPRVKVRDGKSSRTRTGLPSRILW